MRLQLKCAVILNCRTYLPCFSVNNVYVLCNAGEDSDLLSVEIEHNGLFCGIGPGLTYVSPSVAQFDYCSADSWSIQWIDEFLKLLGYERDAKLHVYWNLPGKAVSDGLVPIENDSHIVQMIEASRTHKTLVIMVDHTNFLRELREDVVLTGPSLPAVRSPRKMPKFMTCEGEASSSAVVVPADKESDDSDSDFKDSDFNA